MQRGASGAPGDSPHDQEDFSGNQYESSNEREAHIMNSKIFVNLAVKDLALAMEFFSKLGYRFNKQFTDETAACMIISDDIYAMLLTYPKFKEFTPKTICDSTKSTEVMICLSCDTRAEVDDLVRKAIVAGGAAHGIPKDYGFMYGHGFEDLDGHIWELIHMEPVK
jgi:predicted lactoylglutathione lyase